MNFPHHIYWLKEIVTFNGRLIFDDSVTGQLFPRSPFAAKVMVVNAEHAADVLTGGVNRFVALSPKSVMPGNCSDGIRLKSIAYTIVGVGNDCKTVKKQEYHHPFKTDTRLHNNWEIRAFNGKLFEMYDLSELLDSTQFKGIKAIQFIS